MLYVFYSYIIRDSGKCDNMGYLCGGDQHHRWWSKQTLTWSVMFQHFPDGASGKKNHLCRRHKRPGLDLLVRKIPWRRQWQSTPVLLPGESHGQRSLGAVVHRITRMWLKWLSTHVMFTFLQGIPINRSHVISINFLVEDLPSTYLTNGDTVGPATSGCKGLRVTDVHACGQGRDSPEHQDLERPPAHPVQTPFASSPLCFSVSPKQSSL